MSAKSVFILFIYFLALIAPGLLAFSLMPVSKDGFVEEAGMLMGMSGLMMVFFQFVISARIKWIDRLYGYNNVLSFHRRMGKVAFGFILAHLLLLTLAEQKLDMLTSLDDPWYVNLGKLTFLILAVQVFISIGYKKITLTYERWRTIHDLFAVAILVLMFIHSFFAGDDLELFPLQVIWLILPPVGIAFFIWQRYFLFKFAPVYYITDVIKKAHKVHTIHFAPNDGEIPFTHNPGQFHFIKFINCTHLKNEEHPFTISSSPSQKSHLASTIKASGDFTSQIHLLQKGDKVKIVGPFGKLSFIEKNHTGPIVFIAGGIGITPFMSMLQYMADTNHKRKVVLFYFNETESDIAFRQELNELSSADISLKLQVVYVLSKQSDWKGEKGHFNKQLVEKYCPDPLVNNRYYTCGPPRMSDAVLKELKALDIPLKNIHSEMFGFAEAGSPTTYQKKQSRNIVRCIVASLLVLIIVMAGTRSGWRMFSKKTHNNSTKNNRGMD